jgi:hypothetical protein
MTFTVRLVNLEENTKMADIILPRIVTVIIDSAVHQDEFRIEDEFRVRKDVEITEEKVSVIMIVTQCDGSDDFFV